MTANRGASETRHEILRKMKELENQTCEECHPTTNAYEQFCHTLFWRWETLQKYIKGMAKRASKKKGGLGK